MVQHNKDARYDAFTRLLQGSRVDSFAPYFSDRVMKRLSSQHAAGSADALYDSLRWLFVRTSALGLAAAAILCLVNALAFQDLGVVTNLVDTLFGLPSASISDALSYGAL